MVSPVSKNPISSAVLSVMNTEENVEEDSKKQEPIIEVEIVHVET